MRQSVSDDRIPSMARVLPSAFMSRTAYLPVPFDIQLVREDEASRDGKQILLGDEA